VTRPARRPAPAPEPFLLEVFLTSRCNMDCSYCAARYMIHAREHRSLTLAQLKRAAELIAADPAVRRRHGGRAKISFTGGEPMLEFSLIKEAVAWMKRRHPDWEFDVSTNGTLLTPENLDFFVDNGVGLSVSLDGYRGVNDSHRKFAGGGRSAFGVVEGYLRRGLASPRYRGLFHVAATLTSATIGNLPEVVRYFREEAGLGELEIALEAYEPWDAPAREKLRRVLRGLGRRAATDLAGGAAADGAFSEFLFTQAKTSDCRDLESKALTLFYDGAFYPCDFVVKPPLDARFRAGDLERGLDLGRLRGIAALPLFGEIERGCEYQSGLLSPLERYYWGLVHGYSRARLARLLRDTSETNRVFHEELGPYLRLQRAYSRLFMTPGFGDLAHGPKYRGRGEVAALALAGGGPGLPAMRAAADYALYSPGAAKRLALRAGAPSGEAEGLAVYALAKARALGKRLRVSLEDGGGAA